MRSIPACAGEPNPRMYPLSQPWVYPRVCGGTHASPQKAARHSGLSPRVRGNLQDFVDCHGDGRSIPACAGEPAAVRKAGMTGRGLSPRVRGNLSCNSWISPRRRSIPACAGEPSTSGVCLKASTVYPRVCGGTSRHGTTALEVDGLSPRVRGNRGLIQIRQKVLRSIPACAGEPLRGHWPPPAKRVYPRVCGGTRWPRWWRGPYRGLSPRVRGNRPFMVWPSDILGSIPACAGEPNSACQ